MWVYFLKCPGAYFSAGGTQCLSLLRNHDFRHPCLKMLVWVSGWPHKVANCPSFPRLGLLRRQSGTSINSLPSLQPGSFLLYLQPILRLPRVPLSLTAAVGLMRCTSPHHNQGSCLSWCTGFLTNDSSTLPYLQEISWVSDIKSHPISSLSILKQWNTFTVKQKWNSVIFAFPSHRQVFLILLFLFLFLGWIRTLGIFFSRRGTRSQHTSVARARSLYLHTIMLIGLYTTWFWELVNREIIQYVVMFFCTAAHWKIT